MAIESKSRRVRSPSYPSISLPFAIERAKIIYDREKWHEVPIEVILKHWNYSPGSGGGLVQIAALKKYGLLLDQGSGGDRKAKLTTLTKEILIYDDDEERFRAIKEAAKTPILYHDVLNKYSNGLPSDATLRAYLIKEKDFNDNAVGDLISVMRETFEFAKLPDGDITVCGNEDMGNVDRSPMLQIGSPRSSQQSPAANYVPITVVLDGGAITVVQIPRMPKLAFDLFKSLLETYRPAIVTEKTEDNKE